MSINGVRLHATVLVATMAVGSLFADLAEPEAGLDNIPPNWLARVREDIATSEYNVRLSRTCFEDLEEAFQAPNRAQNFRVYFAPEGIRVVERGAQNPTWVWRLALKEYGYRGCSLPVPAGTLEAQGSRVEYRRPDLVEWYENSKKGLEQGVDILMPPAGPAPRNTQQASVLELRFELPGNVKGKVSKKRDSVKFLRPDGHCVIAFGQLHAEDSVGKDIEVWFAEDTDALSLMVNAAGATYPIHVDPLAVSPDDTLEIDQAGAAFGIRARGAGDVNGDGYEDVIVGAYSYDGGIADEGGAFVYYGSAEGLSRSAAWTGTCGEAVARYGYSVNAAGDVNGDGYGDVIVGAWQYDNGGTDQGAAFVYHGSASGLSQSPDWTGDANQDGARYGMSVSGAGDVNGDNYDDVIVGAEYYDHDESDENKGGAFLYHGSASGLSAVTNWMADTDQAGAMFGRSVARAGDVNGDGYDDVIVGAWKYTTVANSEGRAFAYYGSASGLSSATNWSVPGVCEWNYFGYSVATAGDVNNDGYDDVIVGGYTYSVGHNTYEGRVCVYHGSASGLNTSADWSKIGDTEDAHLGIVATAGDINGDGYADVIVGAYTYDDGPDDPDSEGRACVYCGSASGLKSNATWVGEGDDTESRYGFSVATAGDINGDGYSDILVGAYMYDDGEADEGAVFVHYGSPRGLNIGEDWVAEGNQDTCGFGLSLSTAGDVNGDGYDDVIVGAYLYDDEYADEGRAFVYHGSASGPESTPSWTVDGAQEGARLGVSVDTAGDVNKDGYDDVIVGAYMYDGDYANEGRALVYHGSASGLGASPAWTMEGEQENEYFGVNVATAGDVNGDEYSDVIVGAHGYGDGGAAFVCHGSASGLSASPNWTVEPGQADAAFGGRVSSAGDVNGDGYADVIVGAYYYDNGTTDEGAAFVYHGSSGGLSTSPNWTGDNNTADSYYGLGVGRAGDVNGDGYDDVIVGAYAYNGWRGKAYLYQGSASGLSASPDWTDEVEGDVAAGNYGYSVKTAGDIDMDGYDDVLVGAYCFRSGQHDEGAAFMYFGSASGLSSNHYWFVENDQADGYYGVSVSTAGDVNGDGYPDVIVGSRLYDNDQTDEGAAFVYYGSGLPIVVPPTPPAGTLFMIR